MNGWVGYRKLHTLRLRFRAVAPLSLTIKGGIARLRLILTVIRPENDFYVWFHDLFYVIVL